MVLGSEVAASFLIRLEEESADVPMEDCDIGAEIGRVEHQHVQVRAHQMILPHHYKKYLGGGACFERWLSRSLVANQVHRLC